MRKKIDNRIRILIENCVQKGHREAYPFFNYVFSFHGLVYIPSPPPPLSKFFRFERPSVLAIQTLDNRNTQLILLLSDFIWKNLNINFICCSCISTILDVSHQTKARGLIFNICLYTVTRQSADTNQTASSHVFQMPRIVKLKNYSYRR